jgi:hypothetical protein
MHIKKFYLLLIIAFTFFAQNAWGQASLTNGSPTLTIDFSSTISGVSNGAFTGAGFKSPPTSGQLNSNAWAVTGLSFGTLVFGGTQTTDDFARGAVSIAQTTGGIYAFTGSPHSAGNPCLMIQPGGSDWTPGTLTLRIKNDGTTNITEFEVSYNLFVRNDGAYSNSFNFSYSTDNSSYTSVGALDYSSTAASGGSSWVQVGTSPSRSTTITSLNIAPGDYFYIRWSGDDVSGSGSRDEFGLDDIEINATFETVGSTPPTLTAAGSATVDAAFDVTFTDDATWRAAITGITIGGTPLTAGWSVSSGKITFTPSASTPAGLLQTAGSKSIVVAAGGYSRCYCNTVYRFWGCQLNWVLHSNLQHLPVMGQFWHNNLW